MLRFPNTYLPFFGRVPGRLRCPSWKLVKFFHCGCRGQCLISCFIAIAVASVTLAGGLGSPWSLVACPVWLGCVLTETGLCGSDDYMVLSRPCSLTSCSLPCGRQEICFLFFVFYLFVFCFILLCFFSFLAQNYRPLFRSQNGLLLSFFECPLVLLHFDLIVSYLLF